MNKARLKTISDKIKQLETIQSELEMLLEEEQESFDNLPESIQNGAQGERAEMAISALEEAGSYFEGLIESLQNIE